MSVFYDYYVPEIEMAPIQPLCMPSTSFVLTDDVVFLSDFSTPQLPPPFSEQLSPLPEPQFLPTAPRSTSMIFSPDFSSPAPFGETASKSSFLLTPEEMFDHGFPSRSRQPTYTATKPTYRPVTDNSPMFVLDCEMCQTAEQESEVTRVSLLNENGDVILDTVIRPMNEIQDYKTPFSGITPQMIEGVMTRLVDVQHAICAVLPDDAILVGHSLHVDLHALKMTHPYCIDTSLQYNLRWSEKRRTKLRTLCEMFLGRRIQQGSAGHCSIEDCAATMELTKLKLRRGLQFGNVLRGFDIVAWQAPKQKTSLSGNGTTVACDRCSKPVRVACPAPETCTCVFRNDVLRRCVDCISSEKFKKDMANSAIRITAT